MTGYKIVFFFFLSSFLFNCNDDENSRNTMIVSNDPNIVESENVIIIKVEGITMFNGLVKEITRNEVVVEAKVKDIAPSLAPIFEHGHLLFDFAPNLENFVGKSFEEVKDISVDYSSLGSVIESDHVFETKFQNLESNKTYFYISYLQARKDNSIFSAFSQKDVSNNIDLDTRSFTTLSNEFPPGVRTECPNYIASNQFRISGQITETSGVELLEFGFVWKLGLNSNPTIEDNNGIQRSGQNISVDNGHSFNENIYLNPNLVYSIKAYALNEFGPVYGDSYLVYGNFDWTNYDSFPDDVLKLIHEERFVNNNRNWDTSEHSDYDIDYFLSLSANYYSIDNNEDSRRHNLPTHNINFEGQDNFQIDVEVRVTQGDFPCGLRWEGNLNSAGYIFGFDKEDENYSIGFWDEYDNYTNLKSESPGSNFEANEYHKLSIRKFDNIYYLFIDENLVHVFLDQNFDRELIYFTVGSDSRGYFKNLSVKTFSQCF